MCVFSSNKRLAGGGERKKEGGRERKGEREKKKVFSRPALYLIIIIPSKRNEV